MKVSAHGGGGAVTVEGLGPPITFAGGPLEPCGDAPLCMALLPAMRARDDLSISGVVSRALSHRISELQDIFSVWDSDLRRIDVNIEAGHPARERHGTALFYSGGVDSLYTLRKHMDEIDCLITVSGFDFRADIRELEDSVFAASRMVAEMTGKQLIAITTDFRASPTVSAVSWRMYHGSALATVAHLLPFAKVFVASSFRYDLLHPHGSHPLTDPYWSGDTMTIVHSGAEAGRFEKVAAIADDPIAHATLRVCSNTGRGLYNCGVCEKCVRTMTALAAVGAIGKVQTLPGTVSPRQIRRITLNPGTQTVMANGNLRALEESGERPDLARALRRQLRWSPLYLRLGRFAPPRLVRAARRRVNRLWPLGRGMARAHPRVPRG